tara:strand:+ start:25 stop:393 length:369 start_codon:yes stop_codon:yes gene_type:complete
MKTNKELNELHNSTTKARPDWWLNKVTSAYIQSQMESLENFKGFEVKYLPATKYTGERIKITDTRFNKSRIISYDYSANSTLEIVVKFLLENGIQVKGKIWNEKRGIHILFTDNFETLIHKQ